MNITGAHASANNIFSNESSKLSAANTVNGNMTEADYRAISKKEANKDVNIRKDELEYEYSLEQWDQMTEWEKEEAERTFGIFKD